MADQLNSSRTSSTRVRRGAWLPLALALLLALTPDLLPHASVSAQSLSPAAIGAAAVGIEAGSATSAVANPALLGLRRHGFQLVLTPISAGFSNNAFSFKDIESYFLDHWEQKENDAILALIPDQDGAWTVRADWVAGARLAAGPVGFGGSIVLNADGRVDKDILDLLLNGNELNRAYSLARSEANVVAVRRDWRKSRRANPRPRGVAPGERSAPWRGLQDDFRRRLLGGDR